MTMMEKGEEEGAVFDSWVPRIFTLDWNGLVALLCVLFAFLYMWMVNRRRTVWQIASQSTEHDIDKHSAVLHYTACKSPGCVRCNKYKSLRTLAGQKFNQYCTQNETEDLSRLISAFHSDSNFQLTKQKPNVFYVQSLRGEPWWKAERFSFVKQLEMNSELISKEIIPVFDQRSLENSGWTRNATEKGAWETFYLYNQGSKIINNCQKCPSTVRLLDNLQGIMSDCIFGNILFSVLYPGTVIDPHYGPTNIRLRCHLGLQVSPKCYLEVGGSRRSWEEGKCIIFDDSFLHSAVHGGDPDVDEPRVVLMLDMWHPDLTSSEVTAIMEVFKILND